MPIRYEIAYDLNEKVNDIALLLFPWVRLDSVSVIRSFGSTSRGTIARCHALGKAMQLGMGRKKGFYVIEVINKRFDKMSKEDQIKTIIHELMHIPKTFGGGFRHHDHVCEKNVEIEYERYVNLKKQSFFESERSESKEYFSDLKRAKDNECEKFIGSEDYLAVKEKKEEVPKRRWW